MENMANSIESFIERIEKTPPPVTSRELLRLGFFSSPILCRMKKDGSWPAYFYIQREKNHVFTRRRPRLFTFFL
jgi:hypothetical protein